MQASPVGQRIGFAGFDHGVNGAGHFCSDGRAGLAAQIGVVAILRDVTLEFVAEAVCFLQDGSLSGEPERASEAGVAIFGDLASAAELPIEAPSVRARWATPDWTVAKPMPQNFRN